MSSKRNRLDPRKTPVQQRSKHTVESVLTAAAQVFELHGYAAGTTNRIASRAGVSIGTLYQYFPNKEAIVVALLERHIADTLRRLHEWVGQMVAKRNSLRDSLRDYVSGILEIHSSHPRLQHILLEEMVLPERVHHVLLEAEREAAKVVARFLQLYPDVQCNNFEHAGFVVVQTVESLTHHFAAHSDEQFIDRGSFLSEVETLLFAYLMWQRSG